MDVDETRNVEDEPGSGFSEKEDFDTDDFTMAAPSFADVEKTDPADGAIADAAHSMRIFSESELPVKFGNYQLVEKVGEGGVGVVFKAIPLEPVLLERWSCVALKVIRPTIMGNGRVIRRFEKESRVLASIESPHVTRFIEFGNESGVYFIATEFVEGVPLSSLVNQTKRMPAKVSLRIIADLLRAVQEIHSAGAIHRDIKPGNVIVSLAGGNNDSLENMSAVKLADFGLARQVNQSESMDMTRQRAMMGTPLFMAPEQFADSRSVDERADIYSVGVTLYQLVAGKAPFDAKDAMSLGELHRKEVPQSLGATRSDVGEVVDHVVQKALQKNPDMRYQSAQEMLKEVEHILNDRPIQIHTFPQLPDTTTDSAQDYVFEWTLDATPKQLWPLVADTDRFNRAIGLPAPEFTFDHESEERKIYAAANFNGMKVRWREHPFQWNSGRDLSVLREFEKGPFEWVTSTVELAALAGNRTRVVHKFRVQPRGFLGRMVTKFQFGLMTQRDLDRAYKKMEAIAQDEGCGFACDFSFGKQPKLSAKQQEFLDDQVGVLASKVGDRRLAETFADYLRSVDDPFVAKIRPAVLANRFDCSVDAALEICFHAIDAAMVDLGWDLICPICRVSAANVLTLENAKAHANCKACNKDFDVDFSSSVEAVFCVRSEIRNVDQKVYCIGGPFHAPHIVAQNHLRPKERIEFEASLVPGRYDAVSPQVEKAPSLMVDEVEQRSRVEFQIGQPTFVSADRVGPGNVAVGIDNQSEHEVQVRLEQRADSQLSFTAAQAFRHPLFSSIMPKDLISSEQLLKKVNCYLLTIRIVNLDEISDRLGDVYVRGSWNAVAEMASRSTDSSLESDLSEDCMVIAFESMAGLLRFLDSIVHQNNFPDVAEAYCFAATSGIVMVDAGAGKPVFGKAVRRAKKATRDLMAGQVLVEDSLWSEEVDLALTQKFARDGDSVVSDDGTFLKLARKR